MIRRRVLLLCCAAVAGLWPAAAAADVVPRSGTATFTDLTGGGACALPGEPPDNLHVGLSTAEFGRADVCGAYLDVTGPEGTVRVQVTDHCRRCPEATIDITRKAFARIAEVDAGRAPVRYELVRNPPLAGPLAVRVKAGSSAWFLQLQVLDHGNPLRSVELAVPGGGWRPLTRTADNHWQASDPGPGEGPFRLRITDVHDQSATVDDVTLTPSTVQPTTARLYDTPAPPPTTTTPPSPTPPPPAPAPAPVPGPPAPEEPSTDLIPLACAAILAAAICARRMIGHHRPLR